MLLIDHNMALIMDVCDRILVLDQGRTLAEGSPDEVRANLDVAAAYLGISPMGLMNRARKGQIVVLIVGCMLALHLLSLFIGFAPKRRTEARTAAKASPPVIVAPQPVPAVIAFARPAENDPEPVTPPGRARRRGRRRRS